jgi:hypothetical protein
VPGETEPSERPLPAERLWRYPWVVVAAPVVLFSQGLAGRALYAPADGGQLFIPWFLVSARAWLSGHLPTWNPWAGSGMPLLGSSQAGALYPPNLLFLVLPAVIANNVTIAVTFAVAGLGAWLLTRRLTGDGVAAAVGGVGFGTCSLLFAHIGHQSLIAGAAWLPWMLYGYELARERVTPLRLAVPAVALAMAVFAGHSQLLFTDLLLFAVYVVGGEFTGGSRQPLRHALVALAAVAAGFALGAVQLWPTFIVAAHSVRRSLDFPDAMSFSLPVRQLPMLAFPYLFGKTIPGGPYALTYGARWNLTELTGYPGMAILVLAGAGVAAGVLRRQRAARALALMGAAGLLMALGPATPLGRLFYGVPPFGQFRAWARFLVGLDLGLAGLAAYGTAALRTRAPGRSPARRRALAGALVTAGLAGAAALLLPHLAAVARLIPGGHPAPAALAVPAGFAAAGAAGAGLLARSRRVVPLLLAAVIVADSFFSFAAFFDWRETSLRPAAYTAEISASTPFPGGWGSIAREPGGIGRYFYIGANIDPIGDDFVDLTDARMQPSVNANNVLMDRDYARMTNQREDGSVVGTTNLWGPASHVFDLLRVTTVLLDPTDAFGGPQAGSLLAGGTAAGPDGLLRYTYVPKLAEAFVVGATARASFGQEVAAVHGLTPFDPAALALLDQPCLACPTGPPGLAGSAGPVTWGADWSTVTVTANRPGLLVLSQAWSQGWQATVRGRSVPAVRVDGLVQGVPVPAGRSLVRFSYHAPGLRPGLLVSVATAAAFLAAGAIERHRLRHRRIRHDPVAEPAPRDTIPPPGVGEVAPGPAS